MRTEVKIMACMRYIGSWKTLDDIDDSARISVETFPHYVHKITIDIIALYKAA